MVSWTNYNLQKNLVRCPPCFKSGKPRSNDLILTNRKSRFRNTVTIEMGLSDFHEIIVTILKGGFVKRGPKVITHRDYSKFSAVDFKENLVHIVSSELSEIEDYGAFQAGVMRVLNEHVPVKKINSCKRWAFYDKSLANRTHEPNYNLLQKCWTTVKKSNFCPPSLRFNVE